MPPPRKSSVVVGQHSPGLVSKAIESEGGSVQGQNPSQTGEGVEVAFRGRVSGTLLARSILKALVIDSCGAPSGTVKRPEGDVQIDCEKPLGQIDFHQVMKQVQVKFDELPLESEGVAAIAEITYGRCLKKVVDLNPSVVLNFPSCLCGGGERFDLIVAGVLLVSIRIEGNSVARVFTKSIDALLGRMCSTAFVDSVLPSRWKDLESTEIQNLGDLLEDVQISINDYWEGSPQNDRSKAYAAFLMSAVGSDLRKYFSKHAHSSGGAYRSGTKVAEHALSTIEDWVGICERLTTVDWGSTWNQKYIDSALVRLKERLSTVVSIRTLFDEISERLDPLDMRALRGDSLWDVFESIDLFDVSQSIETKWQSAVATFYRRLEPIEHRCANSLRDFFSRNANLSPQAILAQFMQVRQLMKRPVVSKELVNERDGLLAKLSERLQTVRVEFEHRFHGGEKEQTLEEEDRRCQAGRHLPAVVNRIIWLRQIRGRIEQMTFMTKAMLADLGNASDFESQCETLLNELEEVEQETFKNWTFDVSDNARRLTLDSSATLLELDAQGKVEVNYSERLVQLLREVRVFAAMGFRVPPEIQQMAVQGQKFYQSGVALKQVATTYNGMQEDIIESTRAMLYDSAISFEHVITASGDRKLTWKNVADTNRFIDKLRNAAGLLSGDNRRLHRLHTEVRSLVLELFKIDLLRTKDRWMAKVRLIREKMAQSRFTNMGAWMRHWDMQIYKALEHQYQQGLESLHESVNEIKADVVYDSTSGKAVLRPPMETLRVQFYQRIKDFLTFPNRFQGVGNSEFFQLMPGHNERGILAVMQHASLLFKKIEKEVKKFAPMLVIGQCGQRGNPTLEEIVAAALTEVQHWEQNIRLLKQKGKDIAGVDLFVKIDCFTLCTAPIKQTVEEHLAKLADVLNSTIRKSAAQHLEKITQFLDKASEALDGKLTKLDEIGKANMLHAELMEQRPSIEVEFHHFFNKNKLLQSMTNSPGVEYQQVKSRWDGFVNRLDSHEKEMEEQLAKMKGAVDESVKSWQKNLERFNAQWHELKPKDVNASGNASKFVAERREQFEVLKTQGEEVRKQCVFFHMDEPNLQIIEDLESDIGVFAAMWATWSEFQADLTGLKDEPWITFRSKLFRMEDFVKLWQDKMRESTQASNNITVHIRILLDEWARATPIFKFVRGDGFTPSHWNELFRLLQIRDATQDTITFGMILDRYEIVLRLEKDLKNLHARAQGEAQIREALDDVRAWGSEAKFSLVPHPDRKGVVLITEWKELLTSVNDNQALLFSMKDSPFFSVFANDATKWEQRLAALDDYLHTMNSIQRKWVYLEPIFARGALPNEQERFMRVDKEYLMIMKGVETDSKVLSLASHAEYKDKLRNILEQLERCQKALNEFLEQKRDRLPRFYFISDDDLLEILGQSKNPVVIQSHLKKLFMGIHSVKFDNNKRNILAIQSLDGEHVALKNPVQITDEVEEWLDALDKAMKSTLQAHLLECLEKLDVGLYASQILCASEQVHFTKKTEEAMRGSAQGEMKKHRANLQAQLRELTAFSASNTDAVMELKLKALIMDLIHNIEVVDMLIANNVDKETDWLWRKQLRFYIGKDGLCTIRMVDASFKYSYEYQGNAPKLVHTPLTDRCYLTLTQGMQLGYGGNPYGPAGTGKTESVKALGNAMGRQVLVFNCDEGIDFKSMGRIFTGLVKCGAWGCFDEFNRLKVDQLSAVSQMIQVIQEALKNGEDNCNLLGRRINVDANAGIFVTLNPAGKGYGGRSKLPDNLKQLFRSVAMSAPDNELIAETILYSEGFEHAKELAKKMVEIFRLSKQLLSAQQHYDWGLRAMKAVLRLGGVLVHQYLKERISSGATPSSQQVLATESEIIIKSLRVNTLSKLTFDDAILFNNLISDVFPGIDIREIQYEELRPAIVESIKELKLQLIETQVLKILQLYEALQQRMGVVLVGPSGSGKSTLLKILRKALQRLNVTVPMYVMNPKAMPRHQLLGYMDMDTREWFDGVLTEAAKKVVREENTVRSWIFCDGDIDPEWVESLNSVLDDNKLLTMPNGVRIQFGGNVNFVFETHSLEYASPATVSRMGMIFLSEEDVDPRTAVATWLDDQPAEIRPQLGKWIQDYFYQAIDALLATKALIVDTTKTGLVMSGLSQLQGCTTKAQFAQGIIYGLGSYLIESQRIDYAKDVLYMVGERAPDPKNPLDFMYDVNRAGYRSFQFEPSMDLTVDDLRRTPMVNTVDCQRNTGIMQAWTRVGSDAQGKGGFRPFILVGPEGCGKTMLLTNLFANIPNSKVAVVNCSAQTVASHVIQKLKQMCQVFNTNQGRVLRPKEADRLILLLKDLNLPKPDRYGTVQLHSFLQQLVLYQGFYDSDLEWVTVERLQIVGSMNPPGSMGRFPVAPRFIAIVSVLTISYPTKEALQTIYSDFFNIMLQGSAVSGIAGKSAADIARAMTTVYETVIKRYTVDDASHYIFNPRDLTNWALNVCNYSGAEMSEVLAYEGRRIFMDRLVRPDDRTKFEKYLRDALAALNYSPPQEDKDGSNARCFVSWLDAAPAGKRKLTGAKQEDLKKTCETALMQYCRENADLNIQLIPEVLSWISRVDRVLSQENGNLLMVGRTGVCSPEMVRLVAFHSRMEVVSLNMTRDYNIKAFNLELKVALQRAGVEGLPTVLLLEDHNFFSSQPLEMINSLLSSGDVPGLFGPEEIDALLGPLKEEALGEGLSVYGYFVTRVRKFLHVCVVMDPTNAEYQIRCRSNPALFTRCTVCWLGSWQSDSLKLVPRLMLRDVFRILDQRDDKKDFSLTTELVNIHKHAGERFSPHHFKTLCDTYSRIFQQKNSATGESLNRLKQGLAKLAEAQENVDTISKEVTEKKALMEVKQKEADEALVQIQQKMEEAGDQKKNIQKIQKDIDGEQKVIEEKKSVIEGGLANIQPTLDAARAAVGSISSSHLSELKSLKSPPPAVQDVLEGVLVLLGSGGDTTWAAIRKFLAGDGVRSILTFDVKSMSVNVRDAVEKLIKTKENSFKPEVISRASQAAAPMAAWLKATVDYSKVLDTIQPMTDELSKYEANLNKGKERKQKYEEKLAKVEKKVDELKKNFGQKTKEAERLKDKLEQAETLLKNANDLLGKLAGEKTRWGEQVKVIQRDVQLMPRRSLAASAFITYLGNEPEDVRRTVLAGWLERLKLDEFNFFTFLRTESTLLQYKAQGLPGDELSMDNAVSILEQVRTPIIVDPASQAVEWLRNNLKERNVPVDVCNISDERLVSALELAIRFGKTFIITDVDKIEPFLYPLLRKELKSEGTKRVIQIGDRRSIDYADGFQLFLVTRSTDLRISPDATSYLTEVSFTITQSGLEGQLLGVTIQYEQPELEQQKIEILKKEEALKLQLATLEESLLRDLASSQGSLLENTTLIESLNQIKTQASEIEEALSTSKTLQVQLDEKRNVYRSFAATGSTIFFLIKNLSALSHMYQFSLGMFLDIIDRTLKAHSGTQMGASAKIEELTKTLIRRVVESVSRALLKEHRVTFGIHLARSLNASALTEAEWSFFVDRAVVSDQKRGEVRIPSWVLPDSRSSFQLFAALFPELMTKINLQESDVWYQWMGSSTPEVEYPLFLGKISAFQRLLVIKALRADRLIAAMNLFACQTLQVQALTDNSSLQSLVQLTRSTEPILLITTAGADPSQDLQQIAYQTVGREKLHQIAMGGGQTDEALRLLRQASQDGHWLVLKNLHLVIPWVSVLQKELNIIKPHDNFRLWLTSEAHDEFPQILLSNSLKVTFEAPPGVKQNLVRTFNNWSEKQFQSRTPVQTQLLFIAAWLHAIVQERRSYIPQGWAKFYEFSAADLKSATDIIVQQTQNNTIDWRSIHGLLENAIYGGRMETEYDVRILRTYLNRYLNPEMLSTARKQQSLYFKVATPATGKHRDFETLIQSLADNDVPALFSLPPNADRVVQSTNVAAVVNDLQRMQETKSLNAMTREEWSNHLTPLLNTWLELTQPHSALLSHSTPQSRRDAKPIEGFVDAEVASSIALLRRVNNCTTDLRRVIEGTLLLSEARRTESNALIAGEVPLAWDGVFCGPERIVPWFTSLVGKAVAIQEWQALSNSSMLLKSKVNLSSLLRPQTFLNALRQETSHLTREPLVSLKLVSKIGSPPTGAALPVCLTGLLLQGAVIDETSVLSEIQAADAAAFFQMPDVYIGWVLNANPLPTDVAIPAYVNASKEVLLTELTLPAPTAGEVERFILAGISIVLE